MIARPLLILFGLFSLLTACEEKIDLDLNAAASRVVIDAQLSDASAVQRIRISKSVAFDAAVGSSPITGASVIVKDNQNHSFTFQYEKDGNYIHRNFKPVVGRTYSLNVTVQKQQYSASSVMPAYVAVDSTRVLERNIAGKTYFFAALSFKDPIKTANYYLYTLSLNGKPFRFASAQSDQFNNGLRVIHYVSDLETELSPGDDIIVRRYCVDEKTYNYWSEYQNTNLSNAVPGNPTSNISNNALGYFSVAPVKAYTLKVAQQ
ncbi:DUF4249 domain-containing protein [Sphingobacterium sp. N143]|uniref:DUF4249 domain-containing protein n=1 Tax=Sphingobacterium sp. N143 TaxID=2746727 RepID=UPI0025762594|nr:DUF4249 domain-containing protein [Sphingobacterium sp. N143]MDM1295912.1 DUF4249 domain-containing protein [Sphingobacterium sp. N143]